MRHPSKGERPRDTRREFLVWDGRRQRPLPLNPGTFHQSGSPQTAELACVIEFLQNKEEMEALWLASQISFNRRRQTCDSSRWSTDHGRTDGQWHLPPCTHTHTSGVSPLVLGMRASGCVSQVPCPKAPPILLLQCPQEELVGSTHSDQLNVLACYLVLLVLWASVSIT